MNKAPEVYIQISLDQLGGSHNTELHRLLQVGVPLTVLRAYFDTTVIGATVHPEAAEHSHSTINGTPTRSSHSGTAYYETHVAGQRNLDVYTFCEQFLQKFYSNLTGVTAVILL